MKNKRKLVIAMAEFMGIKLYRSAFTDCNDMFTKKNSQIGDYKENLYDPINNLEQMWDVADKLRIATASSGIGYEFSSFYAYSELPEYNYHESQYHQGRKESILLCIADVLQVK